ncbi:unnamed protein product [Laminaria digitata]
MWALSSRRKRKMVPASAEATCIRCSTRHRGVAPSRLSVPHLISRTIPRSWHWTGKISLILKSTLLLGASSTHDHRTHHHQTGWSCFDPFGSPRHRFVRPVDRKLADGGAGGPGSCRKGDERGRRKGIRCCWRPQNRVRSKRGGGRAGCRRGAQRTWDENDNTALHAAGLPALRPRHHVRRRKMASHR